MSFKYEIKTSARSRHVRISVYPDGRVVVTKPDIVPVAKAMEFAQSKSDWILQKVRKSWNRKTIPLPNVASKSDALAFVKSRIEFYNQHYKFDFGKVTIKNHKSMWGSCSSRINLNFNSRILALLPQLADYIIVHELCHIGEFNHSKRFWQLVAEQIPDYKRIKQSLKLFSFG